MQRSVFLKLSAMMFLQYFIWGAWFPPSFSLFGDSGFKFASWTGVALTTAFPVSAIIAMFFGNQFVDRNFAAEKFLAFSHFVGGVAMLIFGALTWKAFSGTEYVQPNPWPFIACMWVHCLFYVPTISVTNSIAFAAMKDPQKDFGPVRLWGTIGWVAAAWPIIFLLVDWAQVPKLSEVGFVTWLGKALGKSLSGQPLYQATSWAFITSGIASLLLAGFSLTLPHTPPKPMHDEKHALAWLEAMKLLKNPFLFVLFVVTYIDATVHDGYFIYVFDYLGKVGVPSNWIQPAMSVGQIAEIGTMAILGYVLKTLGWRYTMILGILGHAVRFSVFAFVPNPYVAVAVNILHGICYAFYFATLYILVDEVFPKDARTSAQGLFNFLVLGLGPITSRFLWPYIQTLNYTVDADGAKVVNYKTLMLYPAAGGLIAAILLALFFHPPKNKVEEVQV